MKNFQTNDVLIRKFKETDVDKVYEKFNLQNNISNISDMIINKSKDETQRIIESAMIEYYTEEPMWVLEKKHTKEVFGFIKIDKYSPKNKFCNISWAIVDNCRNEALFTQACLRIINYLFHKKGIEVIECSYYDEQNQTGEILNKIGMKKEAVLSKRRYNELTKRREDYVIYSIDVEAFKKEKLRSCI